MLVKKFEAPSMKEALNMVKTQLGPDAIILSARENTSGFGLVGKGSVEVTAAVSETQLKKKKVAESRMRDTDREQLRNSTARVQRDFIQKSVARFAPPAEGRVIATPTPAPRAVSFAQTSDRPQRYADMDDEGGQQVYGRSATDSTNESRRRVKEAARSALTAAQSTFRELSDSPANGRLKQATNSNARSNQASGVKVSPTQDFEMSSLRQEVQQLKTLLESFQFANKPSMTFHPGAEHGLAYEVSFLYQRLTDAGLSNELATQFCQQAQKDLPLEQLKKRAMVDAWAAKSLLGDVRLAAEPFASGVHLFLGAAGQGKTSALVKLASHFVLKEQKPIMILTTDSRRVGAAEQLKIYAQILNVPFAVIRQRSDWDHLAPALKSAYAVLVDFPGVALKNIDEIDLVQRLMPPPEFKKQVHLVLSSNQKDHDAHETAKRYKLAHFDDFIFTKLDESANHGLIFNMQKDFHTPLHSFSVGPLIPEDFEVATRERVIDLIFKISKLKGT